MHGTAIYSSSPCFFHSSILVHPTDVVVPGGSSADVPIQMIYMVTTDGGFDGVVGRPIIEYHTADGVDYSDFMAVVFVDAPDGYTADTFKSVGDITDSGASMTMTDIVLNIPVVPTGSTLQHPVEKGTAKAPITPTMVFYRGTDVTTYVFEVTDASAAAFFADTRSADGTTAEGRAISDYAIPVVPFATPDLVTAIRLWHFNQFSYGVVEGVNGGGPNPAGMRNVINLDRPDPGYSPLWQILWATEVPINYEADQFSNAMQATEGSGFEFFTTPMYVNCPDIGPVGMTNDLKATSFEQDIVLTSDDAMMYTIIGSAPSLIMQGGVEVTFVTEAGDVIGSTETNMMGGYEYTMSASDIPEGVMMIKVMSNEEEIRTIMVTEGGSGASGIATGFSMVVAAAFAMAAVVMV